MLATIDVVADEEVVLLTWDAGGGEDLEEVGKLAVDVATNFDRGGELEQDWLLEEDVAHPMADHPDLLLLQHLLLVVVIVLSQPLNHPIYIQLIALWLCHLYLY